jgi:DNA-binding SARP family transcriptional activator
MEGGLPRAAESNTRRPEPAGLVRPRLLAPLVSEDAPGVVVVIAPPGSGKTTLLSRAAAHTRRPVGWFSTGPDERPSSEFVERLAQVTAEALGIGLGCPGTAADLSAALEGLPDRRLLLVLDDVHELEGFPAQEELSDLLRLRPRHVRIALGTRRPLQSNTPRLMVSGELIELDSEALRFRSWEVEELFRLVYGEPLSPEAAAALTRRTGGWAAGLMLFHLATKGKSAVERERAVADLGGRSRLLRSYLTRNVLDELDPVRREFLLATCTLGTLTGPLCDALLECDGSAAVLEDLAARQFFTTLDENGRAYRYHQVLQTLLEGLLVDELGHRAAADLYARSARLLESGGLAREALRAYAMAEDFASVTRVLQQSDAGVAMDPAVVAMEGGDDPWLAMVRARRLQRAGSFDAAVVAFRDTEALLDDSDFRRRCAEERAVAHIWLADATIPDQPGPGASSPRALAQAVRLATRRVPAPDQMPCQPLAKGVARLLAGEFGGAVRTLEHVVPGSMPEQLCGDLALVVAEIASGATDHVVATLERIILTAEVEGQSWLARVARGLQAAVLLVVSREPWRAESCESLVEQCARVGDGWGEALLAGALGVAHTVRRDRAATRWLDRASDLARSLNAPVLSAWAECLGAFVAREFGDPGALQRTERARELARTVGVGAADVRLAAVLPTGHAAPEPRTGTIVRCLGKFGIEAAGEPLAIPALRPLPRALLLLLAVHHGQDVHREVLIEQLWPGTVLDVATHRLHAAASSVRRCLAEAGLGHDVLRRHGSAYCLQIADATLDVAEFESLLQDASRREVAGDHEGARDALLAALDFYRGELLEEAGPADWVVAERDRLRVAAAEAALSAARLTLRLRPPAEALSWARRATELDPLRDSAWALLAETQERMGDTGSAAATWREHALVAAEVAGPRLIRRR